jgi:hypothetical protein
MQENSAPLNFEKIIAGVKRRLPNESSWIAEKPSLFNLVWWPGEHPDFQEQLLSDYGVDAGPTHVTSQFTAEIKAIHESLDETGYKPVLADWQKTNHSDPVLQKAASTMYTGLNQRGNALSVWEQIAFPIRRENNIVFRIHAPRDVMGGMPIIHALQVDDFIKGVSVFTVQQEVKIIQLQKQLTHWKAAALLAAVVAILLYLRTQS